MRMLRTASLGALIALCLASPGVAADPSTAAFERLKSLVGTWTAEGGEVVTYALTGRGSAVVEMFERDGGGMGSVYHMDGDALRVTHYCGAGNQPRMRGSSYDPKKGVLEFFDFVDITNLSAPDAYHTREISIVFKDENHIRLSFNGMEDGKEFPVVYELTRRN